MKAASKPSYLAARPISTKVEIEDWDGLPWLPDHNPKTYLCHNCASSFGVWTSNEDGDTYDVEPIACPHCGARIRQVIGHGAVDAADTR